MGLCCLIRYIYLFNQVSVTQIHMRCGSVLCLFCVLFISSAQVRSIYNFFYFSPLLDGRIDICGGTEWDGAMIHNVGEDMVVGEEQTR